MRNILRRGTGVAIYISLIGMVLFYQNSHNIKTYADSYSLSANEINAISYVNDLRDAKDLKPLKWNSLLAKAASDKANDLVFENYFDHISPTGKTPWFYILNDGYNYKFAGENLAIDYDNVKDATVAWKNSPSHYANIVSDKYLEFGFAESTGIIDGKQSRVYVEMFGSEKSAYDRVVTEMKGGVM